MNPKDEEEEPDTLTRIVLGDLPKKKVLSTIPGPDLWQTRRICEKCGADILNDGTICFYCETQPPTVKEMTDAAYGQLSTNV